MPKLTTCCNAEIEAVRFGDDSLDHCSDCRRCVEGENEYSHITPAPEFREISLEERNAIYEATGGCFGSDPDAYGRAVEAATQRLNDPLANHRQWQESDPMYRQGKQDAIRELTVQARNVREAHGEQAYIKFITETLFGEPATSETQRMLRAIDRDSETSGHRDFRRAA